MDSSTSAGRASSGSAAFHRALQGRAVQGLSVPEQHCWLIFTTQWWRRILWICQPAAPHPPQACPARRLPHAHDIMPAGQPEEALGAQHAVPLPAQGIVQQALRVEGPPCSDPAGSRDRQSGVAGLELGPVNVMCMAGGSESRCLPSRMIASTAALICAVATSWGQHCTAGCHSLA